MKLHTALSISGNGVTVILNGEHFLNIETLHGVKTLDIGEGTSINPFISYPNGLSPDEKKTSLVTMFDFSHNFSTPPEVTKKDIISNSYKKTVARKKVLFNLDGTPFSDEPSTRIAKIDTLLIVGTITNLLIKDSNGILTMNNLIDMVEANKSTFDNEYIKEFFDEFGDVSFKWNRQFSTVEPIPLSVFDNDCIRITCSNGVTRYRDDSVAFLIAWLKDVMAALPNKHFTIVYKNTGNPWGLRSFYGSIKDLDESSVKNCTYLVV